jgi:hypothetical protein
MGQIAEITAREYDIETLTDIGDIEKIRDVWERFNIHPNSDIDFYLQLQSIREDIVRPHIFLLKENGIPVAMAVGRIESSFIPFKIGYLKIYKQRVRILNIVAGGIMGEFDEKRSTLFINELIQTLNNKVADVAIVKHIPVDSLIMFKGKRIPSLLRRGYFSEVRTHRTAELPGTLNSFLERFGTKQRSTLRRNEKRLRKNYPDSVILRIFKEESEVSQLCEHAESIAKLTYQRGIDSGFKFDDEHFERLNLAAKKGWLRAYILYVDEKPCAFWIGTLYKDVFHSDFIGYDATFQKYSPGMIIFLKMVEDLSEAGVTNIDFGLGDAGYKKRFADKYWEESNAYIFASTFSGLKINFIRTLVNSINYMSYRILRNDQLLEKIKKKWRDSIRPTG